MSIVEVIALVVAVPTVVAYVCRLGLLQWKLHQPGIILLHVAGCGAAFGVGVSATQRPVDLQDALSLAFAALWIVVSIFNWRGVVPSHWNRP